MTPTSAVSKVEKIGYELVKERKSRGKAATMQDYAKMNFEPWSCPEKDEKTGLIFPTDDLLLHIGFLVRTASVSNSRTKERLGDAFEQEAEIFDSLMADLAEAMEQLKAMILTMDSAYVRIISAASARVLAKEKKKRKRV